MGSHPFFILRPIYTEENTMAYKHSKGARKFDDITAENDSDGDTKIDFDEDYIALKTNGNNVLVVSGSNVGIGVATPDSTLHIAGNIHVSGSNQEGIRIAKGASDYRQIVFETDGVDSANIHLSNAENLVIQNETNGKDIQFWTNPSAASNTQRMVIKEGGNIGINEANPQQQLHVDGFGYFMRGVNPFQVDPNQVNLSSGPQTKDFVTNGNAYTDVQGHSSNQFNITNPVIGSLIIIKEISNSNPVKLTLAGGPIIDLNQGKVSTILVATSNSGIVICER